MTASRHPFSPRRACAALALLGSLGAHGAFAAPPLDPAPPVQPAPPAPPISPGPPGPQITPPASLEAAVLGQAPVAEGRVQRLLINPYGEVDGLLMSDRVVIKLPPHLSDALIAAAAPGQSIRVFGFTEAPGSIKADAVLNLTSGQIVFDRPPGIDGPAPLPPHLRAAQLRQLQVEARVDVVLTGPHGEPNGVLLDNGSIVRFAPDGLRSPLQRGAPFAATGLGTRNTYGTAIEAISVGTSLGAQQQIYGRLR